MKLLRTIVSDYPRDSLIVLVALSVAGVLEGISLTALLPLMNAAISMDPAYGAGSEEVAVDPGGVGAAVITFLTRVGIQPTLISLMLVMFLIVVARSVILLLAKKRVGYTVAQVTTDLRMSMLDALLEARWRFFLGQQVGKLVNAMASEASRAAGAYLYGTTALALSISLVVYIVVALLVSWQATIGAVVAGALVTWLFRGLVRMARKSGKRQTKLLKSLLAGLTDSLQSVKPLKSMGRENLGAVVLARETSGLNVELRREVVSKEGLKAAQFVAFSFLAGAGMYAGLVLLKLPFTSVMLLVLLLSRLLASVGKVQKQYQEMAVCESAYWSLRDTVNQAEAAREQAFGEQLPTLRQGIRLQGVGYSYSDRAVLNGMELEVPVSSLTTLVGPSGAGKTTVVDLVTGLLRPDAGQVLIDGVDLGSLDIAAWRRLIGYVPQESFLLHDTVTYNVTLGDDGLGIEDVERALRDAGAWEFVQALEGGIDFVVGERGGALSGGQRQRIMIARALVHKPQLLILDEATSALDPESEQAIRNTLDALRGSLTMLAISHQDALVESADRVYRIEAGKARLQ